jgi:hypothetical protein
MRELSDDESDSREVKLMIIENVLIVEYEERRLEVEKIRS